MYRPLKKLSKLIVAVALFNCVWTQASAVELPPVENVQINDSVITWDPQEGATGYNIYHNSTYLATVFSPLEYTATLQGRHSVISFNDQGDFGAIRGSIFVNNEAGEDVRQQIFTIGENYVYSTRRCFDIEAGEECIAICPDFIGGNPGTFVGETTGGACNSTDNLAIHSSVNAGGYTCTVTSFTTRVEARAVCAIRN